MRRTSSTPTMLLALLLPLGAGVARSARAQVTTSTSSTTTTSTASTTSSSTIPPALRCKNRLLNRAKKLARRLARCDVRAVRRARKAKSFDGAGCVAKALDRYDRGTTASKGFGQACLDCTRAAIAPVRNGLATLDDELDAVIGCAPEVPITERARCEIKLHKAVAGYQAALMRCRRTASLDPFKDAAPVEAQCLLNARDAFDKKAGRLSCPACVDPGRIATTALESTDDLIGLAHCPCRFGDATACPECQTCDYADGCVAADEGASCGRNGCTVDTCVDGACTSGRKVGCSDSDVCTVDLCIDDDSSCTGTSCCVHEPLCDPEALGACVTECSCDPAQGCSCRCDPGCDYVGCVIFNDTTTTTSTTVP
jgi:hypothetical protein